MNTEANFLIISDFLTVNINDLLISDQMNATLKRIKKIKSGVSA